MIELELSFPLPLPWNGESFECRSIGAINFLVGPNGSGKSQFVRRLTGELGGRLLASDRLSGMERPRFRTLTGDPFQEGIGKNQFGYVRQAGVDGAGIDAFLLLEERLDLRIQIESTLSHLFNREIILEWDSGHLRANMRRSGSSDSYRLDREECHGIKELIVLLTHLYDLGNRYLIIDEPELNLHPQYQAFFMEEVRKIAGDPNTDPRKKVVFLVTHSPFILDLRSLDDFKSVISFDLRYSTPKQVSNLDVDFPSISSFLRRLNVHHKQLFFSDNPIFVEGIHDAWLVEAIMEARGASVAGAGSCIIDAGGDEEVNQYLKLCQSLGKNAHFLYDLDSLFGGNLRACIKDDESVQGFLASAGLGSDLGKYCGQLEQELTQLIDRLVSSELPENLRSLSVFLNDLGERSQWRPEHWRKARTATMTAISRHREDVASTVSQSALESIEGRRTQILAALSEKNIHVLPGGTIERYLPSYEGDEYKLTPDSKLQAINAELQEMATLQEAEMERRYGDLYAAVCTLPSKDEVDLDVALRNHLSRYVHELQRAVVSNPDGQADHISQRLSSIQPSWNEVFSIQKFVRTANGGFEAKIGIIPMLGQGARVVQVSNNTNAGMGDFKIDLAPTESVVIS